MLDRTDELAYLIEKTPLTVDEWRIQKDIYAKQDVDDLVSLGFATFYLNRVNRSGIISGAGVIGGLEQTGKYKIDCRFNRSDLVQRVRRVARYRRRIHLTRRDAVPFISQASKSLDDPVFFCIDPPYFQKGSKLYASYYRPSDHAVLASHVMRIEAPWIVTYDNVPEVAELYASRRLFEFDVNYSAATKRVGTELMAVSDGLRVPKDALRHRQDPRSARQADL